MNQNELIAMYAAAKERGMTCKQATVLLMNEGVDIDTAVDIAWQVDSGRKAPVSGIYANLSDWNNLYAKMDAQVG